MQKGHKFDDIMTGMYIIYNKEGAEEECPTPYSYPCECALARSTTFTIMHVHTKNECKKIAPDVTIMNLNNYRHTCIA